MYQLFIITMMLITQPGLEKRQLKQGLAGYLLELKGNQMPAPGRPASKGRPVIREVYIYRPSKAANAKGNGTLFSEIDTKLIAKTASDSNGYYQVKLAPGKYSVFIKEANQYYANETDGDGYISLVEIKAGELTKKDFKLTVNAVY